MKKKIRTILTVFIATVVLMLPGCGMVEDFLAQFESTPEKTVYGFMDALNKEDVNKALEYVSPTQAKGFSAMFSLAGSFIGIDINDLLDIMPLVSSLSDEYDATVDIDFEITDVEQYEEEAWVTVVDHNSGGEITFYLVLEDGKWYIWLEN